MEPIMEPFKPAIIPITTKEKHIMTDTQIQELAKDLGFRKLGSAQLSELKKLMAAHDYQSWTAIQWIKNIQSVVS